MIPGLEARIPKDDPNKTKGASAVGTESLRDRVTSEDIAGVVARATGIPVQNLLKGEKEKLIHVSWQPPPEKTSEEDTDVCVCRWRTR